MTGFFVRLCMYSVILFNPHTCSHTEELKNKETIDYLADTNQFTTREVVKSISDIPMTDRTEYPRMRSNDFTPPEDMENEDQFKLFKRSVTMDERLMGIEMIHALALLFKRENIEWCLMFGTLAGHYYFHEIIPWDDDWDIVVFVSKKRLKKTLSDFVEKNPKFGFWGFDDKNVFKFYHASSSSAGWNKWNWPFVDVFNSVFDKDRRAFTILDKWVYDTSDFFPLRKGYFEGFLFPIPANAKKIIDKLYDYKFGKKCYTWYNHRNDEIYETEYTERNCAPLKKAYAWVSRHVEKRGGNLVVVEILRRGEKELHKLEIHRMNERDEKRFVLFR